MLLRQGRWREAWPHYEYRLAGYTQSLFDRWPRWEGQPLVGKTIVVSSEQGIGDTLQFARYVSLLRRRGAARVIFLLPPDLHRVVATIEGVDEVQEDRLQVFEADYSVFLLSLPLHFDTTPGRLAATLPAGLPVVRLPRASAPRSTTLLRVGVFWAGGVRPDQPETLAIDARRSIDFNQIAPFLLSPGLAGCVRWTVLQKHRRHESLPGIARAHGWLDPFSLANPDPPKDLYDTALIIEALDLVIGVDSALIHLAASLGKPTWMLDRADHCWRWFGPGARDWYPGALRLFRQPSPGDWPAVIDAVRQALLDALCLRR